MPTKPAHSSATRRAPRKAAATKAPAKKVAAKKAARKTKTSAVTYDTVREILAALPGIEEGLCYGTPGFRVKGKFLIRLREEDSLVVPIDTIERDFLLETDPATFYITDHYRDWPYVLVRLSKVDREELRDLLERAWRRKAPKRLLQAHDAGR